MFVCAVFRGNTTSVCLSPCSNHQNAAWWPPSDGPGAPGHHPTSPALTQLLARREPGPAGVLGLHFHLRVPETLLAWAVSLPLGTSGFDAMGTFRLPRLSLGLSGGFCVDPDPRRKVKVGEPGKGSGLPWFTTGPGERGVPSSLGSAVPRERGIVQGRGTHRTSLLLHPQPGLGPINTQGHTSACCTKQGRDSGCGQLLCWLLK